LGHLSSCVWHLQASIRDFPDDSWVVDEGLLDADPGYRYIFALHWSFQTLTTVGYGDVTVGNKVEKTFACLLMIFGAAFYSYMIGALLGISQGT